MRLILYHKGRAEEIRLDGTTVVGRGPASDLRVEDKTVSAIHAEFRVADDGSVFLKDLNSTNGTFLNGKRISEETLLHDGDRIQIGNVTLIFSTAEAGIPVEESRLTAASAEYEEDSPTPVESRPVSDGEVPSTMHRLVAKDGRWFLRDEKSGREVEIVPVRKGGKISARIVKQASYSTNIAASLIILVVGAAVALGLRSQLVVPPPKPGTWSPTMYRTCLMRALTEIDAGQFERAGRFLKMAMAKFPTPDVAESLLDFLDVWSDPAKRKDAAEISRRLDMVGKYAGGAFAEVASWAAEKKRTLQREQKFEGMLADARQLADTGKLKEAVETLEKIPPYSKWYKKARILRDEYRRTMATRFVQMGKDAMKKQHWEDALAYFDKAVQSGIPAEVVRKDVAACRKNIQDRDNMEKAVEAFKKKDFSMAQAMLKAIDGSGPYGAEADRLSKRIEIEKAMYDAKEAYDRGDADTALKVLAERKEDVCRKLYTHIKAVKETFEAAAKALKEPAPEKAISLWEQVLKLEGTKDNFYRLQAQRNLSRWKGNPSRIAGVYLDKAETAQLKNDYKLMRDYLLKALKADPGNKKATSLLEGLKDKAVQMFLKAQNLPDSRSKEAVKLLQQALQMLPPDDDYVTAVKKEMKRRKKILTPPPRL